MAKYTCNYETLNETASNLKSATENLEAAVTKYTTSMDTALETWTGTAKDNFVAAKDKNITAIEARIEKSKILAEYIEQVSAKILETDTDLTELKL